VAVPDRTGALAVRTAVARMEEGALTEAIAEVHPIYFGRTPPIRAAFSLWRTVASTARQFPSDLRLDGRNLGSALLSK
jgi:hypothetical protein